MLDPKLLQKIVIPKIEELVKKDNSMIKFQLYSTFEDVPKPKRRPQQHKLGYFETEVHFGGTAIGYIKRNPLKVAESTFRLGKGISEVNE